MARYLIELEHEATEEARAILSPIYRNDAKIVEVIHYTLDEIKKAMDNKEY